MQIINHIMLLFEQFVQKNITVSLVILGILIVRIFIRKLPKKYSFMLWGIVGFKMLFDISIPFKYSIESIITRGREKAYSGNGFAEVFVLSENTLIKPAVETRGEITTDLQNITGHMISDVQNTGVISKFVTLSAMDKISLIMSFVWMIGILIIVFIGIRNYIKCFKLVETSIPCEGNIYECDGIRTPFVMGLINPKIYIPFGFKDNIESYVIEHEKYHIKRGDLVYKLIAFVLLAVYWINPLVWCAFFCFAEDMEMSCDEAVLSKGAYDIRTDYSKTLVTFAVNRRSLQFTPLSFGESNIKQRIKNILVFKKPGLWATLAGICVVIVIAIISISGDDTDKSQLNIESSKDNLLTSMEEKENEIVEQIGQVNETLDGIKIREIAVAWAEAFCARDDNKILSLGSEQVIEKMKEEGLFDIYETEEGMQATLGWSSPWPWADGNFDRYEISYIGDNTVSILYYSVVSEPHIYVWREQLTLDEVSDEYVVIDEQIVYYDYICDGMELAMAYPEGLDSLIKHYEYGDGVRCLSENAMLSSSNYYRDLFAPDTAARYILNLLENDEKVKLTVSEITDRESENTATVHIEFVLDNVSVDVLMKQPKDSLIWMPVEFSNKFWQYDLEARITHLGDYSLTEGTDSTVYVNGPKEIVLYELTADITHDYIDDLVRVCINAYDYTSNDYYELLSNTSNTACVKVYEGISEGNFNLKEPIYVSREVGAAHAGYGALLLCHKDNRDYLLNCSTWEGQGYGNYSYEACSISQTGSRMIEDCYTKEFSIIDDAQQYMSDGDTQHHEDNHDRHHDEQYDKHGKMLGEIEDFRNNITPWLEDAIILVSCDNHGNGSQILMSLTDEEINPDKYFDEVWDRHH